jgi:hypothetical protein
MTDYLVVYEMARSKRDGIIDEVQQSEIGKVLWSTYETSQDPKLLVVKAREYLLYRKPGIQSFECTSKLVACNVNIGIETA